jgi:hypothetical protein
MRKFSLYAALCLLLGAILIVGAILNLPLEVVLGSPLRVFVSVHSSAVIRLQEQVENNDAAVTWKTIDDFASEQGFQFKPWVKLQSERVQTDYVRNDDIKIDVTIQHGTALISFFSRNKDLATRDMVVGEFKKSNPRFTLAPD